MILRYMLIPEYEVSTAMLAEEHVAPWGTDVKKGAWASLRRYDDAGIIKIVLIVDVSTGVPKTIADYLNGNNPTIYTNKSDLLAVIDAGAI